MLVILAAALAGLAMLSLVVGVQRLVYGGSSDLSSRLTRYGSAVEARVMASVVEEVKPRRQLRFTIKSERLIEGLNRVVEKQDFAERLRKRLAQADLKITVGEFLIINVLSIVAGALIGGVIMALPLYLIVFTLAGIILPHWYLRFRAKRRFRKFQAQLSDTIAMLANSLRSGYSIHSSMELVSKEMGPPVSDEFHRVTAEIGLGLAPEEALANLQRRIKSEDLTLMITAMNINRDVGGNLAEILDIIANTIRERVKLQGEIAALTAQQTLSGYVITGLPLTLALALYKINPEYIARFWTWLPCGLIMAGVSLVMMGLGYVVMRKIVAIEV